MEHTTFKAVATHVTEQGVFNAVISTESIDREKDIVDAAAMVAALKSWNRPVPLSWNHSTKAEDIFGSIEPMTVREENGEVVAEGKVDLESAVGQEAWRSFKNRTVGFSFGYITLKATKRTGGGRHITELDVFEVTATPTPMNNDTRVLSTKGMSPEDMAAALAAMRERLDAMAQHVADMVKEAPASEAKGAGVWDAEYVAALPDSAFLYVQRGSEEKDAAAQRHFPYKDAEGAVDMPNLRHALAALIPESELDQATKDRLTSRAQEILTAAKSVLETIDDVPSDEPPAKAAKPAAQDRHMYAEHRQVFDLVTDGIDMHAPPEVKQEPPPPVPSAQELQRQFYDLMLSTVIGSEEE